MKRVASLFLGRLLEAVDLGSKPDAAGEEVGACSCIVIAFRIAEATGMGTLAKRIAEQIRERGFCLVFSAELERCWPSEEIEPTKREKEIEAFAKAHGWNAFILTTESGIRAIFRPQKVGNDQ